MQYFSSTTKLFLSLVTILLLSSCGIEGIDTNTSSPINPGNNSSTNSSTNSHSHPTGSSANISTAPENNINSLAVVGDRSIPAVAGIGQLANPNAPLEMKLLIISATEDDSALQAAEALMKQVGVPYDILIAKNETLTSAKLTNGTSGRYQGIILTTASLPYQKDDGSFASAFEPAEWQVLWSYESDFAVRQLTLYTFPSVFPEDYGIKGVDNNGDGFADGNGNAFSMTMTPEGQAVFPSLKANANIPVKFAFNYPSVLDSSGGVNATPILKDNNGNILGVLSTSIDGRERMALTMGHNPSLLHTQLLGYDMLRWLTQGVFIGERRMYLSIDVDDWYLESDVWNPATLKNWTYEEQTFRIGAKDVYAARDGVLDIRDRFNAPTFNYIQVFNALKGNSNASVDCSSTASLSAATLCTGTFFDWVSHTFSHANMNQLNYDEVRAEFEKNIQFAESQPLEFDKKYLVTGRHSGLGWGLISNGNGQPCEVDQVTSDEYCQFGLKASNSNMLKAAADLGIEYLAANRGWNTHTRKDGCDTCLIVHPLDSRIKLIPRWPTNIFYNTTTPTENASEFNYLYGANGLIRDGNGNPFFSTDQSWQEVLKFEADIAMRHVLSFSPYPHFFHQNNLKEYSNGRNLIYDWAEATLKEYDKYFDIPIISQDWEGITTTLEARTSFFEGLTSSAISGTWNRSNNTIQLSSTKSATVYVTGANLTGGTNWTYGPDKVSQKALSAGQSVIGSLSTTTTNSAPTLSSIPTQNSSEGNTVAVTLSFNDSENDYLGFSASNLPPGLAINPATGKITGTHAINSAGTYNVIVKLSDGKSTTQQSFVWTVPSIGFFIKTGYNKCVTISDSSTVQGARTWQIDCNNSSSQKFEAIPTNGGFMLKNVGSGLCLGVPRADLSDRAYIEQRHCGNPENGDNQIFYWDGNALRFKHSNKCVDASASYNRAFIWQHSCHELINQQFKFEWPQYDQGARLKQISAINANNAWGVNTHNNIYRTSDGGRTWQRLSGSLKQVSAIDANNAWGVNVNDQIYRTSNGGNSWQGVSGRLKQVSAIDANNAWGVNVNDQVYRTSNGGSSWQGVSGRFKQVSAIDANNAWSVNANDEIYSTSDGGGSWQRISGSLKQISAIDANNAWGVNLHDQVFHTSDGGRTWQQPSQSVRLQQVSAINSNNAWAIDSEEKVYRRY